MTRSVAAVLPDYDVVAALPSFFDQEVPADYVDLNGHMNITHYFALGACGPWKRMAELGMPEEYMAAVVVVLVVEWRFVAIGTRQPRLGYIIMCEERGDGRRRRCRQRV